MLHRPLRHNDGQISNQQGPLEMWDYMIQISAQALWELYSEEGGCEQLSMEGTAPHNQWISLRPLEKRQGKFLTEFAKAINYYNAHKNLMDCVEWAIKQPIQFWGRSYNCNEKQQLILCHQRVNVCERVSSSASHSSHHMCANSGWTGERVNIEKTFD